MWAALVTMSSIVGKKVSVDMGHFEVFPNLYVVFVAPPGGRKSTAMDFAGRFLEEMNVPMTFDCVTKEALAMTMAACETSFVPPNGSVPFVYSPLTILATELSEFLGPSKEGMISFLTTLFDKRGDYKNKTIKRGDETIVKPYLVLLGCTTPAWITARLRDDVISGGFSRRAIFVYETDRPDRIAFPEVTQVHKQAWDEAIVYSKNHLSKAYGKFQWDPEARSFFKHWYDNMVVPKDPYLTGYYESKHVQALKIAQLIALSEDTGLVLRRSHLEFALELLGLVESNLPRVFEGVGRNELNGAAATLHDFVRSAGGMLGEKQCYTLMFAHCSEQETKQVVEFLLNSDRLIRKGVRNTKTNVEIQCLFTPDGLKKMQRELEFAKKAQEQQQQPTPTNGKTGLLSSLGRADAPRDPHIIPNPGGL